MDRWRLFRGSFVTLPYLFYVSFVGIFLVMMVDRFRHGRTALDPLTRNSLAIIGGLLILSCCFAGDRTEAFLQLVNFLPFFLFFSVLPYVLKGTDRLATLATDMVIAAIPLNLMALGEYLLKTLKFSVLPRVIRRLPEVRSLRAAPHKGRAMVMFTHPNSLANYLVLILGLGLGLILHDIHHQKPRGALRRGLLYSGTSLTLVGIFCSGSRNGLGVAIAQILIFCLCIKTNRKVLGLGFLGLLGLLAGVVGLGLGRRSLSLLNWTDDPRPRVWGIALEMIGDRPWLGWGLGNYKFEFLPRLLQEYPACVIERTYKVIPSNCADVGHAHNFWLLLGAEAGLVVTMILTAWVGYICFRGVRSVGTSGEERSISIAYLLAFGGCVAFALFDVTFYDVRLNATNWFILAGIYTMAWSRYICKQQTKSTEPTPD
jgi:O-antigen ligase